MEGIVMYNGLKRTWLYTISQLIFIAYNLFVFIAIAFPFIWYFEPEESIIMFGDTFMYLYGAAFYKKHLLYSIYFSLTSGFTAFNLILKFYMLAKNRKLSRELKKATEAERAGQYHIPSCSTPRLLAIDIVAAIWVLVSVVLLFLVFGSYQPGVSVRSLSYSAFVCMEIPVIVSIIRINLRMRKYRKAFAAVQMPSSPQPEELGDAPAPSVLSENEAENSNEDIPTSEE